MRYVIRGPEGERDVGDAMVDAWRAWDLRGAGETEFSRVEASGRRVLLAYVGRSRTSGEGFESFGRALSRRHAERRAG